MFLYFGKQTEETLVSLRFIYIKTLIFSNISEIWQEEVHGKRELIISLFVWT